LIDPAKAAQKARKRHVRIDDFRPALAWFDRVVVRSLGLLLVAERLLDSTEPEGDAGVFHVRLAKVLEEVLRLFHALLGEPRLRRADLRSDVAVVGAHRSLEPCSRFGVAA